MMSSEEQAVNPVVHSADGKANMVATAREHPAQHRAHYREFWGEAEIGGWIESPFEQLPEFSRSDLREQSLHSSWFNGGRKRWERFFHVSEVDVSLTFPSVWPKRFQHVSNKVCNNVSGGHVFLTFPP